MQKSGVLYPKSAFKIPKMVFKFYEMGPHHPKLKAAITMINFSQNTNSKKMNFTFLQIFHQSALFKNSKTNI